MGKNAEKKKVLRQAVRNHFWLSCYTIIGWLGVGDYIGHALGVASGQNPNPEWNLWGNLIGIPLFIAWGIFGFGLIRRNKQIASDLSDLVPDVD